MWEIFLNQKDTEDDGRDDKLIIENSEYRAYPKRVRWIEDLTITTTITINDKVHWDYEYIGSFKFGGTDGGAFGLVPIIDRDLKCVLDFNGGKWDKKSEIFRGNFLKCDL